MNLSDCVIFRREQVGCLGIMDYIRLSGFEVEDFVA